MGQPSTLSLENIKIAYLDDSKLFLSVVCKIATEQGAIFLGIDKPTEAIQALAEFKPDLIITDLEMPGTNGIEIIKKVRANEVFQSVPIVLLTASDDASICSSAIECGADDFIAKVDLTKILIPKIAALLRIRNNNLQLLRLKEIETVSTMVATYRHEFNNAIMIFEGRLRQIQKQLPEGVNLKPFENINESLSRMKSVLKSLSDLKKVETTSYSGDTKILKIK